MSKDWTGNKRSTFATLGASNHTDHERQVHDFYATDPIAIDMLAQTGFFTHVEEVWEPAVGGGHLAKRMKDLGLKVVSSDLHDYGFISNFKPQDFLEAEELPPDTDAIVTNPPYKYALEFCQKCVGLEVLKFAMFLKLTFLEGAKRQEFFQKYPPKQVAVCVNRVQCALNGDAEMFAKSSAACYAWFIWERGYQGHPEVLWLTKKPIKDKYWCLACGEFFSPDPNEPEIYADVCPNCHWAPANEIKN